MTELDRLQLKDCHIELACERDENDSDVWYLIIRPRRAQEWKSRTEEDVEFLKSQIESKLAQAEEIERVIHYMIDFNTKIPDNPNRKYYETGIEILRKIQGRCYCGLEFDRH